jgi:O-antigen ligase
VRAHDGWIFLLVLVAGIAVVAAAAVLLGRALPVAEAARRRIERSAALAGVAALAAIVVAGIVEAHRIWRAFANPVSSQIASSQGRLGSLNSSNRWRWWQEAWNAFVHHPGGGTGAGTFQFTDLMHRSTSIVTTTEPHNVPLQFLSETGIVGFLLFLAVAVAAIVALVRVRGGAAVALAIAVCVFFAHLVVDVDWDYVATCGPLFFVAGALVVRGSSTPSRRPLTAAAAVLVALAAVYSLAAPYAALHELGDGTTLSQVKSAHSFDPLSADVLEDWGALETAVDQTRAQQLYRDAVSLEPENTYTWLSLGDFFWETRQYADAYLAYSDAWAVDKFGPAGVPCGPLDQARHRVLDVWPPSCPGGRPASTH